MQKAQHASQAFNTGMEQAERAARSAASSKPSGAVAPSEPARYHPDPLPDEQVDEIFARMAARYRHAWTSAYVGEGGESDDDAMALAMAEWSEALAGLSEAQIRAGFRADFLRGAEWPPGPPAFAAMCHGIPSFAQVKHILAQGHPGRTRFTRLVWSLLDTFAFTLADARFAHKLLAEAYELAKTHVMSGDPLPDEPAAALEQKPEPRTPARAETAERCLREAMRVLDASVEPEATTGKAAGA